MVTILTGDCIEQMKTLPDESVHCCVTSPPYWGLRDYGRVGQIGLEPTPEAYVAKMVEVFREVRRVLRDDGTCWLNLGDSYAGGKQGNDSFGDGTSTLNNGGKNTKTGEKMPSKQRKPPPGLKPKDLVGIPWRVAFALQSDGWYLRQDIIWSKPNPMPESVTDRCTKAHEYIFLLAKSAQYYYDAEAVKENIGEESRRSKSFRNGRNKRSVWTVATAPYSGAHFATFPPALITPCILAGCPQGGTVLDPFGGSGTVGEVAEAHGRNSILIELNPAYVKMAEKRTAQQGLFCNARGAEG